MKQNGMDSIKIQKEPFKGNKVEGFHLADAIHSNFTEFPFFIAKQ